MSDHPEAPEKPLAPDVVKALVDHHRAFLAFVERRVGDRGLAEEIVQDAFVRGVAKADSLPDQEAVVPWFYRVLRNAVIDHYRRRDAHDRKLEALAAELDGPAQMDDELGSTVCQCLRQLADTLKPEYAEAIRRVDLEGASAQAYADEAGITRNNAHVRVFRAREALRARVMRSCGTCAQHGCLDCTCETKAPRSDAAGPSV